MLNRNNYLQSHSHRIAIEMVHNDTGDKKGDGWGGGEGRIQKEGIKSLSNIYKKESMLLYDNISLLWHFYGVFEDKMI